VIVAAPFIVTVARLQSNWTSLTPTSAPKAARTLALLLQVVPLTAIV
jgi:hypothetical protein